jgi:hypothetical protein
MAGVITGAIINAVAGDRAANTQANAATSAANTQAEANRYATDIQKQMFDKQIELQEPWRQAGVNALTKMQGGDYSPVPTFAFNYNQNTDPGTQFRLQQGLNAMNATAAARGGLISGNALKAGQDYGQAQGSQEYQNAFNRYLKSYDASVNQANVGYNRAASLAGVGQTATNQLSGAAQTYGANAANLASATGTAQGNAMMAGANARASSYQGYGTAAGQLLGGVYNMWNNRGGNGGATYSGPDYGSNSSFDNSYFDTMSYD